MLETQYFGELDEGIVEILRILAIIDEKLLREYVLVKRLVESPLANRGLVWFGRIFG